MRLTRVGALRATSLWLTLFAVTACLFHWETGNWAKAVSYGLVASSLKFPAVWLHGIVWNVIGCQQVPGLHNPETDPKQ